MSPRRLCALIAILAPTIPGAALAKSPAQTWQGCASPIR